MGIGRIGGLWREGNYESARGFNWCDLPKTDPPSRPLPSSYIIYYQQKYKRTNPFLQGSQGDPRSCTTHRTIAAVRVFDVSYSRYTDSYWFLCYLLAAHKGTSIHLCTPKLFFCVKRMCVLVPPSNAGDPPTLIGLVDIFHHYQFFPLVCPAWPSAASLMSPRLISHRTVISCQGA